MSESRFVNHVGFSLRSGNCTCTIHRKLDMIHTYFKEDMKVIGMSIGHMQNRHVATCVR